MTAGPSSGSVPATVVGINGQTFPTNAPYTYTNSSGQFFAGAYTGCIGNGSPANQTYNLAAVFTETSAYTIGTNADQCALELINNTSGLTVSLPPASGAFGANYTTNIQDIAASGTVTITPLQIGLPTVGTPTTLTTGGSLPASTTYYVTVSAVDGAGQTTAQSVQSVTTGSGTATNTVTVPITAGTNGTYATSYNLWYSTSTFSGGSTSISYCTVAATASTYTITGTSAPCAGTGTVPSSNTTASTINGGGTLAFSTQYQTPTLWSDGANWHATGTAVGAATSAGGVVASFSASTLVQATTNYYGPASSGVSSLSGDAGGLAPIALTLKGFVYHSVNAPASGQTFTVTVYVGTFGSETATAITCTVTNPNNSCSDTSDTASMSVGQTWVIQVVTSTTSGSTGTQVFGLGKQWMRRAFLAVAFWLLGAQAHAQQLFTQPGIAITGPGQSTAYYNDLWGKPCANGAKSSGQYPLTNSPPSLGTAAYYTMGDMPDADPKSPIICTSAQWAAVSWDGSGNTWATPTSDNAAANTSLMLAFLEKEKGFSTLAATPAIYYISQSSNAFLPLGNDTTCASSGVAIPNRPDIPCLTTKPVMTALEVATGQTLRGECDRERHDHHGQFHDPGHARPRDGHHGRQLSGSDAVLYQLNATQWEMSKAPRSVPKALRALTLKAVPFSSAAARGQMLAIRSTSRPGIAAHPASSSAGAPVIRSTSACFPAKSYLMKWRTVQGMRSVSSRFPTSPA